MGLVLEQTSDGAGLLALKAAAQASSHSRPGSLQEAQRILSEWQARFGEGEARNDLRHDLEAGQQLVAYKQSIEERGTEQDPRFLAVTAGCARLRGEISELQAALKRSRLEHVEIFESEPSKGAKILAWAFRRGSAWQRECDLKGQQIAELEREIGDQRRLETHCLQLARAVIDIESEGQTLEAGGQTHAAQTSFNESQRLFTEAKGLLGKKGIKISHEPTPVGAVAGVRFKSIELSRDVENHDFLSSTQCQTYAANVPVVVDHLCRAAQVQWFEEKRVAAIGKYEFASETATLAVLDRVRTYKVTDFEVRSLNERMQILHDTDLGNLMFARRGSGEKRDVEVEHVRRISAVQSCINATYKIPANIDASFQRFAQQACDKIQSRELHHARETWKTMLPDERLKLLQNWANDLVVIFGVNIGAIEVNRNISKASSIAEFMRSQHPSDPHQIRVSKDGERELDECLSAVFHEMIHAFQADQYLANQFAAYGDQSVFHIFWNDLSLAGVALYQQGIRDLDPEAGEIDLHYRFLPHEQDAFTAQKYFDTEFGKRFSS